MSVSPQRHALTVLTRLAARRPEERPKLERALEGRLQTLWADAIEVAKETGDPIGRAIDAQLRQVPSPELALDISARLPRETVALQELAVTVERQAVIAIERCVDGDETRRISRVVLKLLDLSVRLARAGRDAEALETTKEAIARIDSTPGFGACERSTLLGRAYAELSSCLSALGDHNSSLDAARRALEIRESRLDPDDFDTVAGIALTKSLVAASYSDLGDRQQALAFGRSAVASYDELVKADARKYRPYLAGALSKLGTFEILAGEPDRSVASAKRALELYRMLAERDADGYSFHVAVNANNLANTLSRLGHFDAALACAEESLEQFRKLSAARPDAFEQYFAVALNTLSNRLNDLGRTKEAIEASRRSVAVLRALADRAPRAFAVELGRSLHSLAYRLVEVEDWRGAISVADEVITMRQAMTKENFRSAAGPLALSLAVKGAALRGLGLGDEACSSIAEALQLLVSLSEDLGSAIRHEAAEIATRYLAWHREFGKVADNSLVETLRARCGLNQVGEPG